MGFFDGLVSAGLNLVDNIIGNNNNKQNNKTQLNLAKNSIQYRVADARKAGINPIYALGAPGLSAQTTAFMPDLASSGQDLSRAIDSVRTAEQRLIERQQIQMNNLQLEHGTLENDMLRSQIARLNSPGTPPAPLSMGAMESYDGSGGSGPARVEVQPARPTVNSPTNPAREAGVISDFGFVRNDRGGLSVTKSYDMYNRAQDDIWEETLWNWRNRVLPALGGLTPPNAREYPLPPGYNRWRWDWQSQSFFPYSDRTHHYFRDGHDVYLDYSH